MLIMLHHDLKRLHSFISFQFFISNPGHQPDEEAGNGQLKFKTSRYIFYLS